MLTPGTILQNRYRIIRQIGQGGMGAVYEAKDQRLGPKVALKQLIVGGQQLRRAFEREARVLAHLRHSTLPNVIDHFVEDNGQYLVMEYIEGHNLGELQRQHKHFPVEQVLEWADLLLKALEYLHNQQPPIIHRDIKPENLKLTPQGNLFLLDFGLAKGGAVWTAQLTADRSIMGYTPNYAPLEQIEGSGTHARSDLYSLAATLYHLLTGQVPPTAVTRANARLGNQPDPIRPANELNPQVPPAVAAVLTQALALHATQRPSSAASMRAGLWEARYASRSTTSKPSVPTSYTAVIPSATVPPQRDTTPSSHQTTSLSGISRQWLTVIGVLATTLLILIGVLIGMSSAQDPSVASEPSLEVPAQEEPTQEPTPVPTQVPTQEPEPVEALTCEDAIGCVEIGANDPINIAYMLVTSGAVAFLGEDSVGGIEIAIDDRGGKVLGHEIELTGEDSLCSAQGGQTAAQKVAADDSIVGVIGTNCSSAATAALPIISEAGLLMISPSNTAPTLTSNDTRARGVWQPGYYRTSHNDLFQGRMAAEFAFNELGARTVATVHDGSPYADGLQQVFADVIEELGGEVTYQGAVNVGDTDMRPILTEIAANPPDVLYFPIFEPEAPLMVAQSSEIEGLEDTILMGADAVLVESFPENAGPNADGMYFSGTYVELEGAYGDLLTKWDEKYGGAPPSGFHGHAYDATNMLLDAIESVAQVAQDGSILIGRQALRDAITAISGYQGVTGVLTCNRTGDCSTGEALGIFQITDAEINNDNWPPNVVYTP